jgi:hypothetical protein
MSTLKNLSPADEGLEGAYQKGLFLYENNIPDIFITCGQETAGISGQDLSAMAAA